MTSNMQHGFTLIELLVVVLIIAILAAVALPQYQMAIGKARFAELKVHTKYAAELAQQYFLLHDTYDGATTEVGKEMPAGITCSIWNNNEDKMNCCKTIFNANTCLYAQKTSGKFFYCVVFSTDKNDLANKLCKKETGHPGGCPAGQSYCSYLYP